MKQASDSADPDVVGKASKTGKTDRATKADLRQQLAALQTQLQECEADVARLQRIAGISAFEIDVARGLRSHRSPEYMQLHGLPPEAADETHADWLQRVHPEDRARADRTLRDALAGKRPSYESEYRILRPNDGTLRWIHAKAEIERDEAGTPRRLVGAHLDITERKQAEQASREYAAHTRIAVEAAQMATWDWDLRTDQIIWNAQHFLLFGLTPPASPETTPVSPAQFFAHVHPDERPRLEIALQTSIANQTPFEAEFCCIREDGSLCWMSGYGRVMERPDGDSTGRPMHMSGVMFDITTRRQAEEALRASERRQTTILDTMAEGVVTLSRDNHFMSANPAAAQMLGVTSEELVGCSGDRPPFRRLTLDGAPRPDRPTLDEVAAGDGIFHDDYIIERRDGSQVVISRKLTGLRDSRGNCVGFVATITDITDRRRIEVALLDSEERFRGLVMASSDVVYQMSADWREMNDLKGHGFLPDTEEPSALWIEKYIPVDERPRVLSRIQNAIHTRTAFELEHRVILANGNIGWVLSRAVPLLDAQGEVRDWFGAANDITQRVHAEAALRESEERYRAIFNSINEGFSLLDIQFDDHGRAYDIVIRDANPAQDRIDGVRALIGKRVRELLPDVELKWIERYAAVARSGEAAQFEDWSEANQRWYSVNAARVGGAGSTLVAIVYDDITERKLNQQRQEFLLGLNDVLRPLADPVEIQAEVTRTAMNLFGADRCYFCEIENNQAIIRRDATRGDLPSVVGVYPLDVLPILQAVIDAGQPFVVRDAATTDLMDESLKQLCLQMQIISFVNVPVVKNGRTVGVLCTAQSTPREWTPFEITLAKDTAERTWAAVERGRAETALRASETKYRALFETIDEGVAMLDLIRDEQGQLKDLVYREVNPAFERQSGMQDAAGRKASELRPQFGQKWLSLIERVIDSGKTFQTEDYLTDVDRWVRVRYSRISGSASPFIAAIFEDITARKRHERQQDYLLTLSDAIRPLSHAADIEATACRLLGEHLGVGRVYYPMLNLAEGNWEVEREYTRGRSPSMVGKHELSSYRWVIPTLVRNKPVVVSDIHHSELIPPEDVAAMEAIQIVATVAVPLVKNGMLIGALSVTENHPRVWKPDEVDLVRETLERTWAAVERVRVEESLRVSETRFRTVSDTVPQLIWTNDAHGKAVYFNQRWFEYSGLSYWESVGLGWQAIVHPDDAMVSAARWQSALAHGETFDTEFRLRGGDGNYCWFIGRNIPLRNEQGRIVGWFGSATDIESLKQAEQVLQRSQEELEELVTTRTAEFVASQSQLRQLTLRMEHLREEERIRLSREVHDVLGGSLSVFKINLAKLIQQHKANAELTTALNKIHGEVDGLAQVVHQIASDLRPPLLDFAGIVPALEWQAHEWEQRTGIPCWFDEIENPELDLPEPARTAVFRVFQETLTNVVRHAKASFVTVRIEIQGTNLVVSVHDDGRGIDMTEQPLRRSLGVIGMKERLQEVGGDVALESELGHGTTVHIRAPLG